MTSSPIRSDQISRSVVSDSLGPRESQPANLLCPWSFLGKEFWSGLLLPSPGDLLNPEIELESPVSPALEADSLLLSHLGSPCWSLLMLLQSHFSRV